MLTRRGFLGAAAGAAAMSLAPEMFAGKTQRPIGVQLYTVRTLVQTDLPGTLKAIRKIGYQTVEAFAAQAGKISAKDLRAAVLDAGLTVPSAHFGYNDFEARLDYAKELGVRDVICSMIPRNIANSVDGYKRASEQYNKWGEKAKSMSMRFGFHNHNGEFQKYGDVTGFDVLMQNTDPALVLWQMDCYWVTQAGLDPVAMFKRYGKRMQSLHLKDRKPNAPTSTEPGPGSQHFAEVGEGTLDWKSILSLAERDHIRDMFVEMDITELPPLQSLEISYKNLVKFMS